MFAVIISSGAFSGEEYPLALLHRILLKPCIGLEWLPYRVGQILPGLRIPDAMAGVCGFPVPKPLALSMAAPEAWVPPPHLIIGNFWLDLAEFRQHMLTSTLVYFLIFMALSELRQLWGTYSRATAVR